jgi:hypothetical protein
MKLTISLLILLLIFCFQNFAQQNPLTKKVTISIANQSIEKVLVKISLAGNVNFSYNPDLVPVDSLISVKAEKMEIKRILDRIFHNRFDYKTTGQHIIIVKKKKEQNTAEDKLQIHGFVVERFSGQRLANVSVYNLSGKEGVLTDKNGQFTLKLVPSEDYISLGVNKRSYRDTIVFIKAASRKEIDIMLSPKDRPIEAISPRLSANISQSNLEQNKLVTRMVKNEMMEHAWNIDFLRKLPAQISLVPFIGSNHRLSGSIVNKFSVNVIAGYSYGVDGVEVGSFLNLIRNDVKGIQLSGFGNITGRNTHGIQVAGQFNHNLGKVTGIQLAGFSNFVMDTIKGIQVAGTINIAKGKVTGAQLAGFANILHGSITGAQVSGFMNITTRDVTATQLAGVLNLAMKSSESIQIAGFANITKGNEKGVQVSGVYNQVQGNLDGVQVAGFANIVRKDVDGVQVSGFLNKARNVKGMQIGFINIADTVSDVSIGLFNFIKKGIHQLTLSVDETGCTNLDFSLGSYRFYSLFGVTAKPVAVYETWGYRCGIGTMFKPQNKLSINIELISAKYFVHQSPITEPAEQQKLSCHFNWRIAKRFNMFIAPSYSVFILQNGENGAQEYPKSYISPEWIHSSGKVHTVIGQFGLSAGIKFN